MIMKPHQKHANLIKPQGGKYHRLEFGLMGAPCGTIQKLCKSVNDGLKTKYKMGYMDADHGSRGSELVYQTSYTNKIDFHQINFHDNNTEYSLRNHFSDCDLVLVNGNHFKADKQIVIINPEKKESLKRKLDRLTDVVAFVLDEGADKPFDFS